MKLNGLPSELIEHIASKLTLQEVAYLHTVSKSFYFAFINYYLRAIKQHVASANSEFCEISLLIKGLSGILQVSACRSHDAILGGNKQVYMLGKNNSGQLGVANQIAFHRFRAVTLPHEIQVKKVQVAENRTMFLTDKGKLFHAGASDVALGTANKRFVPFHEQVIDFAIAKAHTIVINTQGQIFVRGSNYHGKLGLPQFCSENSGRLIRDLPNMVTVSAGKHHTVLLSSDGLIYVSGDNSHGQLGLGNLKPRYRFTEVFNLPNIVRIKATDTATLCQNSDGKWFSAGDITKLQPPTVEAVSSKTFQAVERPLQNYQLLLGVVK